MTPEDHFLTYAKTGDDAAFAEVVHAYSALVYGTAFRRTRNAPLSEEISQNVFLIAAKKASNLSKQAGLGAWLHRTTLFESRNALRSEAARARRLRIMKEEAEILSGEEADHLREVLDEALDCLPDVDRRAVFLRFFEGREFEEIGRQLGKSGGAAQKQIRRALESLGGILNRKGFVVSSVSLAAFLTPELTRAAPVSLQAGIIKASQSLSTSTPLQIMASTKSIVVTAAVIVAALIPLGLQGGRIDEKQKRLAAQSKPVRPAETLTALGGASPAHASAEGVKTEPLDGASLVAAFLRSRYELSSLYSDGPPIDFLLRQLRETTTEQHLALIAELEGMDVSGEVLWQLRETMVRDSLTRTDPGSALDLAIKYGMRGETFHAIVLRWAESDFASAYAYLQQQRDAGLLLRRRLDGKDPDTAMLEALGQGLAWADLDDAFAFVEENIDSPDAMALVKGIGRKLASLRIGRSSRIANPQPEPDSAGKMMGLVAGLPEAADRAGALLDYAAELAGGLRAKPSIAATREFLDHSEFPVELREDTLHHGASQVRDHHEAEGFMMMYALSPEEDRSANLIRLADFFDKTRPKHLTMSSTPADPEMRALRTASFEALVDALEEAGQSERARRYRERRL